MNVDIYMDTDVQQLPAIVQQVSAASTGAHDKILERYTTVGYAVTGTPLIVYINKMVETLPAEVGNSSISEQLNEIKEKLGLNLSQLSKILNVSRPQLYKWLEGDVLPQSDESNQKIADIYSLLNVIPHKHSKYIGKLAKRYVSEKNTVFDMLTEPGLNKEKLLEIYDLVRNDIEAIDNRKAKELDRHISYSATEIILPPK